MNTIDHPDTPNDFDNRFWPKVKRVESGCWEWQAGKFLPPNPDYGRFSVDGKIRSAHRVLWIHLFGKLPNGIWVLHRCDNPPCVNPFHLYAGTPLDNARDCTQRGRRKKIRGRNKTGFGENHHKAKLTEDDVLEIRKSYRFGKFGLQKLANRFGVSKPTIEAALKKKSWKHV